MKSISVHMAMTWMLPMSVEYHSGNGTCVEVGTPHSPPESWPVNIGTGAVEADGCHSEAFQSYSWFYGCSHTKPGIQGPQRQRDCSAWDKDRFW